MFGLKIVKSSYINTLKQDLDEAINYSNKLREDYKNALAKVFELNEKVSYLNTLIDSINKDIESKDSHIVKMGNELSKSRELYNESVKEKETLKRAYMDIEKKHKLSSKLLSEARRRYIELEDQIKIMSDRIKYLENHVDPEALDNDVSDEVVVDEDKITEVVNSDTSNDTNVENKKKSKKRKKPKKNE